LGLLPTYTITADGPSCAAKVFCTCSSTARQSWAMRISGWALVCCP
jgi:hypothetical protein